MNKSIVVFTFLDVCAMVFYSAILMWGALASVRMGVQSISRTLSDNFGLTIFYIVSVIIYGDLRFFVTVHYFVNKWATGSSNMHALMFLAAMFGMFQIVCFVLVGFVTLDDTEVGHYIVAGFAVLFSFLRELVLFLHRRRYIPWIVWFFNVFLLVTLVAFTLAFVIVTYLNDNDFEELRVCILELVLFWVVLFLPSFQIYDLWIDGTSDSKQI